MRKKELKEKQTSKEGGRKSIEEKTSKEGGRKSKELKEANKKGGC